MVKSSRLEVVKDTQAVQRLLDMSPFPMWVYDLNSLKFLYVNESAINLYGYSQSEFLSMTLKDIRPKEDIPDLLEAIERVKSNSSSNAKKIYRHLTKEGKILYVHVKGNTIQYEGKSGELITIVDLTEDRQKDNKLIQQQLFLTTISEINSHLLGCKTFNEALKKTFEFACGVTDIDSICYFRLDKQNKQVYEYALLKDNKFSITHDEGQNEGVPEPLFSKSFELSAANAWEQALEVLREHPHTKAEIDNTGIKSIYVLKAYIGTELDGYITFDDRSKQREWTEEEQKFFHAVVSSLSQAMSNIKSKSDLFYSQQKYKSIVEKGSDLTAIFNADGTYKYVSPTSKSELGIPPEEFIGKMIYDFIDESDKEYVRSKMAEVIKKGEVKLRPFKVPDAEGNIRLIEMDLTNMLDNPAVLGIVANAKDVTNQIKIENKLELANERYRLASLASRDHVYDWDLITNKVERAGQSLEVLFGYTEKDSNKENFWFTKIHPKDRSHVHEVFNASINNLNEDQCHIEYRFKDKKGAYRTIKDSGHIIRDNNGKAIRLVGTVRDISDVIRKQQIQDISHSFALNISKGYRLKKTLRSALKVISNATNIEISEFWSKSWDDSRLNRVEYYVANNRLAGKLTSSTSISGRKKGEGLPGKVWEKNQLIQWTNLQDADSPFMRNKMAKVLDLKLGMGIPITYQNEFLGVLVFLTKNKPQDLYFIQDLIADISEQIAPLLKQWLLEERAHNFHQISPDLHFSTNRKGIIKEVNNTLLRSFGLPLNQILDHHIENFVFEDDKNVISAFLKKISPKKTSKQSIEIRLISKHKRNLWVQLNARYSIHDDLILFVAKDISEQKEVQHNLSLAYDRLKNAQELAKIGYWTKKMDSDLFEISDEAYEIYGYAKEDFLPTTENIVNTLHPEDRYLITEKLEDNLKRNGVHQFENRIITANGEIRWVYQRINILRNKEGKSEALEGTVHDITERKEFERQLALSNRRFELAIEASSQVIWDYDPVANSISRGGGSSNLQFDNREPFGMENSWFHRIHPEDVQVVWDSINQAMKNSATIWEMEYRILDKNGKIAYVNDKCAILRDNSGKPIRVVGSIIDITDSKLYLQKIESQNKSLREIAWMQSHVVRAPLAKLMGFVQLLNQENNGDFGKEELKAIILEAANDLDHIIKEIAKKTREVE